MTDFELYKSEAIATNKEVKCLKPIDALLFLQRNEMKTPNGRFKKIDILRIRVSSDFDTECLVQDEYGTMHWTKEENIRINN